METINAKVRDNSIGHAAKKTRTTGYVPGIIYSKEVQNTLFEIDGLELNSFINKNGQHGTLEINIEGKSTKTIIKEIQRDPVNQKIIHLDLEALSSNKKVITEIPIHFSGEKELRKQGGILQKEKTNIKVECKAEDIPKFLDINLSDLKRGEPLRVGDIELAKEISIMDDIKSVIVSVTRGNTNLMKNVASHEEDLEVLIDNNQKVSESERPS